MLNFFFSPSVLYFSCPKKRWGNTVPLLVFPVTESYLTLCDHMDCSPPGSSVWGIFQARILEPVAISFSRGSSQPSLLGFLHWRQILYHYATWEAPDFSLQIHKQLRSFTIPWRINRARFPSLTDFSSKN